MTTSTLRGARENIRAVPFSASQSDGLNFEGYAAVFNSPTRIRDWDGEFDEQIAQGAFAKSLARQTPVLMFEHGRHPLLGSMPLGVITEAKEDKKGLFIRARLSDNWLIAPVRDAVRDGAISGMSFRFTVATNGEHWTKRTNNVDLRTLTEIDCSELGPVVFPAYEPTTALVRSLSRDDRQALMAGGIPAEQDPAAMMLAAMSSYQSAMQCMPQNVAAMREMQQCAGGLLALGTVLDSLAESLGLPVLGEDAESDETNSKNVAVGATARSGVGGAKETSNTRELLERADYRTLIARRHILR
jgi:HK97 family phage prohead protease